jgi:hypothetical protein
MITAQVVIKDTTQSVDVWKSILNDCLVQAMKATPVHEQPTFELQVGRKVDSPEIPYTNLRESLEERIGFFRKQASRQMTAADTAKFVDRVDTLLGILQADDDDHAAWFATLLYSEKLKHLDYPHKLVSIEQYDRGPDLDSLHNETHAYLLREKTGSD